MVPTLQSERKHGKDEPTQALLAMLKLTEAEIREGKFRDVDESLADLEREDDDDARGGE